MTRDPQSEQVASLSAAAGKSGLTLLTPSSLPASVQGLRQTFGVVTQGAGSFTFSTQKATAKATATGTPLPPLPREHRWQQPVRQRGARGAAGIRRDPLPSAADAETAPESLLGSIPALVIVQGKAPVVTSDGPSVGDYENALLGMPGLSPQVAAQIRAIGDPSATLPIPIPQDRATSRPVDINGASGLVIGDSTGLGSAVVWVHAGMVYAVGGTLSDSEVIAIARSMR